MQQQHDPAEQGGHPAISPDPQSPGRAVPHSGDVAQQSGTRGAPTLDEVVALPVLRVDALVMHHNALVLEGVAFPSGFPGGPVSVFWLYAGPVMGWIAFVRDEFRPDVFIAFAQLPASARPAIAACIRHVLGGDAVELVQRLVADHARVLGPVGQARGEQPRGSEPADAIGEVAGLQSPARMRRSQVLGRQLERAAIHRDGGLLVDNFAGGGGASTGIEMALGRPVDIAINHDARAIAMHTVNHPRTRHYCESVFKVDPVEACGGRPVDVAWFSPDCTHHSKARGSAPRSPRVRGLAWVVLRWARRVKPRLILLENVEEFEDWGPLTEDGAPDPVKKGTTFRLWCNQIRGQGYQLEHRILRACDYGAPTTRRRLFVIARCDGLPIVWPQPTHRDPKKPAGLFDAHLPPWRTAAECIDWSIPCPSVFDRKRPLADATLRRVAAGVMRYAVGAAQPFIVPILNQGWGGDRAHAIDEPMRTITASRGGEFALAVPTLIQTGYGEREGQAPRVPGLDKPLGTVVGSEKHALVTAFLAKHYTGVVGQDLRDPAPTITAVDHGSIVESTLIPATEVDARAARVHAFLISYYGTGVDQSLHEPMRTSTAKDRRALVMVHGEPHAVVDIGLRMVQPRELYRANSFPDRYQIERDADGVPFTKRDQIRMCGNSVPPVMAAVLVRANVDTSEIRRAA